MSNDNWDPEKHAIARANALLHLIKRHDFDKIIWEDCVFRGAMGDLMDSGADIGIILNRTPQKEPKRTFATFVAWASGHDDMHPSERASFFTDIVKPEVEEALRRATE